MLWIRWRVICSVALVAFVPTAAHAQAQGRPATSGTQRAECRDGAYPGECAFDAVGARFELTGKGRFTRRANDGTTRETRIRFPEYGEITRLFYAEIGSDVVVVYEVDAGENGGGGVFRIDPSRMKVKWNLNVSAFNISAGAIEGDRLYEAGIGFVSAINLTKGRFAWKHSGLYDPVLFAFNSFERPQVLAREVYFLEHIDGGSTRAPKTIRVDKATGRILK